MHTIVLPGKAANVVVVVVVVVFLEKYVTLRDTRTNKLV